MPYLIPLAGFAHLKNEQIIKENVFHLDESGDHNKWCGDYDGNVATYFDDALVRINNADHWLVQ